MTPAPNDRAQPVPRGAAVLCQAHSVRPPEVSMQPSHSIFLIDLENFFLSREKNFDRAVSSESYGFSYDLEKLCQFSVSLAGKRRLSVRRAYAPFNVFRPVDSGGKEYYLQHLPPMLMEQGIEPIQVFRYPGGGHKTAADMRLAMDATSLVSTR